MLHGVPNIHQLHSLPTAPTFCMLTKGFAIEAKKKVLASRYFGFTPGANRERDEVNDRKGVGYLTKKLEVCNLSPAAPHPTASILVAFLPQAV